MFLRCLTGELRARWRQSASTAAILAVGIALLVVVAGLSTGLRRAEDNAVGALYGGRLGLTVTQQPAPAPAPSAASAGLLYKRTGPMPAPVVRSISAIDGVGAVAGGVVVTELRVERGTGNAGMRTVSQEVSGVDVTAGAAAAGPLRSSRVTAGRALAAADASADVAVLSSAYAKRRGVTVGGTVTVANTSLRVIGVVDRPDGVSASDVYVPLPRLQLLAGMADQVNVIYVLVPDAGRSGSVRDAVTRLLPTARVSDSGDASTALSGSLATMSKMTGTFGRWIVVAVMVAVFTFAGLATAAAVTRRTREIGTLKALGWRGRRIIGQVMAEALIVALAAALVGVPLGLLAARLVTAFAPALNATSGSSGPGAPPPVLAVALTAPITPATVGLAFAVALLGGLLAGAAGSWRAARLGPAAALARLV